MNEFEGLSNGLPRFRLALLPLVTKALTQRATDQRKLYGSGK
jgi:hypothetical protein